MEKLIETKITPSFSANIYSYKKIFLYNSNTNIRDIRTHTSEYKFICF